MTHLDAHPTVLQIGIRQRSLRRTCRLGRATELVFILATGVTLALSDQVQAQTWDGSTDTDFQTGTNWVGDAAPAAAGAVVLNTGAGNQPLLGSGDVSTVGTVAVSAGTLTVEGILTVTNGVTITGGAVLIGGVGGAIIGNAATSGPGKLTVDATLSGAMTNDGVLEVGVGGNISGAVSSSGTGSNAGMLDSTLEVTGGTFENTGLVASDTTVSGGTLDLDLGSDLGNAAALIVSGGTVNVDTAETVGSVVFSAGAINGAATLTTGTYGQSGGDLAATVSASGAKTLDAGTISGTLTGAGATTVQTGLTTVTGNITGDVTITTGGSLDVDGTALDNTAVVELDGDGNLTLSGSETIGALEGVSTTSTVDLGAHTLTLGDADNHDFEGVISGTGGLTIQGSGEIALGGANTYTGTTTVTSGTLGIYGSQAIADTAAVVVNGGIFEMTDSETIGSLSGVGGTVDISSFFGDVTLTVGDQNNLEYAGSITDTSGANTSSLIKTGSGTLTLSGDIDGTELSLTIQGGSLILAGNNSFDAGITVGSGGTLRLGTNDAAGGVNGLITTTGSVIDYADLVNSPTDILISSATTQLQVTTGAAEQSGDISSSAVFGFEKIGAGNLTVSGLNTYTGLTDVSVGTLTATNDASLGTTGVGSGTTVDGGATLALNGAVDTLEDVTLNGNGVGNGGALRNILGNNVIRGLVTLGSDARINSDAGQVQLSGGITGANDLIVGGVGTTVVDSAIATGAGSLTLDATGPSGVLTLSGTNSFTGGTIVNSGFLQLDGGSALADTGALTINAPGTVQVFAGETVGALSGDGTITLQTAGALVTDSASNTAFSGVIDEFGAVGAFTKQGAGVLTLSGANTYTGITTVAAGGLTVTGAGALASTAVNVTGGTLTTDADALGAGTTVAVSGSGTFTSSGIDSFTAITQTGGTVDGSGVLTLSGAFNQSGGVTGGTVDINSATFTQSGGATVAAGTIVTSSGAQSLQGGTVAGTLDGAGAVTVDTGTTDLTGAGAITVASAIGISASGTLTSDGDAINDTATVTNGGIFTITGAETIGGLRGGGTTNLTGAVLTTGNSFINTFSGAMQGTGGLVVQGTNETALSGTNTFSGGTVINSGTLSLANSASNLSDTGLVTVNAPGTLLVIGDETIGALQGSGAVNLFSGVLTTGDATNTVLTGNVTGAGGLTKQGSGAMQLAGAISHTGTTTVNAGALNIETFGTLRDIGGLVVNTGGTLGLDNAHISVDSLTGTGGTIAMTTTNGSASLTFGSDNSTGSFAGGITGDTALTDLIKEGTGTTTLSGVVNTAGAVTVSGGTLALSGNNTITGGVSVDGRLLLQHNNAAGGAGGMITTTGSVVSYANGVNSATPITIASNTTQLEVVVADAATQSGVISEDAAGRPLEKIGTGTLTLSAANTFTGDMTITGGTLTVTGGAALHDLVDVIVANGGTLNVAAGETIAGLSSLDTNPLTSTASVVLGAALDVQGGGTTFAGNISGSGGNLNVGGTGTLTLTGTNALTSGIAAFGATAGVAITGNGTVAAGSVGASGGTITTDGGAFVNPNASLVVASSGIMTLSGSESVSLLDLTSGTVNLNGAATVLTLTGASGFGSTVAGAVNGTGTLNVTGNTTTVAAAGNVATATTIGALGTVVNNGTMAAVSNAGSFTNNLTAGALTNTGAGAGGNTGTLASLTHNATGLFTNTGAVTGDTAVSNGTLTLSGLSNLSNAGTLNVTGGIVNVNVNETVGVLDADGGVTNVNAVLTAGALSGTAGSIVMTGGANGMVVGGGNTSTTFGGVISGNGGFQKVGTGTLTLTGVNTFDPAASAVTLSGGTLLLDNAGSLAATSITIDLAGRLETDGGGLQTTTQVSNAGTNGAGGFALIDGGDESIASLSGAGTVVLSSGSVLTLNTGASAVSGVISGAGGLTIAGTSATTLSAANTYSGATTVNAGSLTMAAAGSITSATTINGGIVTNNGGGFASVNNITGTFNNTTGTAAAVTNAASGTNGGTIASLTNTGGNFTNNGTVSGASTVSGGTVTNALGTFASTVGLSGTGAFNNNAAVTGAVTVTGGTFTNVGTLASTLAVSGGVFDNNLGGVAGTTTNTGGTITNNGGTFAAVTNTTGTFNNASGTAGAVTNAATGTNGGTIASLSNTGGTFGNSGTVSLASTITGGTVTNTGSMAGVTNSATYIATAATTGALVNTGTATVTGGTKASVANNAGTTTLAGATVTGAVTNTAGTVITSGVTTAATVSNSATLNAAGTLDAVVTNNAGGTFDVTGLLDGGAKDFTNAGTLNVVTASYSNIGTFTNNAGGVVNLTGPQTLSAVTVSNVGGTIIMGGGSTIAGAFTNAALLQASGTTQITGSFVNNGTVDLANGATGDILNISGATSGTGLYQIDLNLSNGTSDRINALVGVAEIHLDFDTVGGGVLLPPVTVFSGAAAGATLTQQDLPVGGAVLYSITQAGNDVQVVSSINPAVSGVAASAAMTQSLISTVVNRPTSPFVSGLAAEEGCSNGGYFRASTGMANVKGTATSNSISSTSDISSRFSGVQGGYDIGCFDGRFFDGWDGALGVMAGYNSGSTNQNVFSDPINPTLQTGTSGSSFKQSYLGIYAAGSKDRFSGDLQLRFDQTEFDLQETALAGFEVGLDGINYTTKSTTVGTRLNYRLDVNEDKGINFVPTVGFNYTTVSGNVLTLDDMSTLSTADDETLTIDGYNTVVGFLGGTLAKTTIDPEGTAATTTFVSGNYYQDFGGERSASYDSSVLPGPEAIAIGSIGGFAEASIGVNYVKILDNGPGGAKQLNANVRADARFGPNVSDSYSVTAQIRLSF